MSVSFELPDAAATRAFGARLAQLLRAGDLVVLTGSLGAGKTTLTQGLAAGLGATGQVASPTFIIAREHPAGVRPGGLPGLGLVHVDAYRVSGLDDLEALDLDATLDRVVTVVEWGEGLVEALSEDRLLVTLDRPRGASGGLDLDDPESGLRIATLEGVGPRWAGVDLTALA